MNRQLLVYGSGRHRKPFINHIASMTGKDVPNICFLPTASGDDKDYIISFYEVCKDLVVRPHVLQVWINSYDQQETFAEIISKMDAIVVGGGNTLNMLAIWKAQGIDVLLRGAYDRGCVMAGGSAGSLCWFNGGTTDSRPKELSIVHGMSFIDKSHCPHYNSEPSRRPLYHNHILTVKLSSGYACDDLCAIHFVDEEVYKTLSLDDGNKAYFVEKNGDHIIERPLSVTLLGS